MPKFCNTTKFYAVRSIRECLSLLLKLTIYVVIEGYRTLTRLYLGIADCIGMSKVQ